jgi:hypothetical protein
VLGEILPPDTSVDVSPNSHNKASNSVRATKVEYTSECNDGAKEVKLLSLGTPDRESVIVSQWS